MVRNKPSGSRTGFADDDVSSQMQLEVRTVSDLIFYIALGEPGRQCWTTRSVRLDFLPISDRQQSTSYFLLSYRITLNPTSSPCVVAKRRKHSQSRRALGRRCRVMSLAFSSVDRRIRSYSLDYTLVIYLLMSCCCPGEHCSDVFIGLFVTVVSNNALVSQGTLTYSDDNTQNIRYICVCQVRHTCNDM